MTQQFDENQHDRLVNGKFTDKAQSKPEQSITAPRKVGTLGGYEIKGWKNIAIGREGGAFTASIYLDGKRVIAVENGGNGGANDYTDVATGQRHRAETIDAFAAFSKKALPDDGPEAADSFIELVKWHGDIDRHAAKHGLSRDEVIEANIVAHEKASWSPLSDREKEILRDPDVLTRD